MLRKPIGNGLLALPARFPESACHPGERASASEGPAVAEHEPNPDAFSLVPGTEPLAGYRLIGRLGGGGFGEVWKADAPGGFQVALKFVRLGDGAGVIEERALTVINRIRHANLLNQFGAWQL